MDDKEELMQINIGLTNFQHESLEEIGKRLGVNKSNLIRLAVAEFILKYKWVKEYGQSWVKEHGESLNPDIKIK